MDKQTAPCTAEDTLRLGSDAKGLNYVAAGSVQKCFTDATQLSVINMEQSLYAQVSHVLATSSSSPHRHRGDSALRKGRAVLRRVVTAQRTGRLNEAAGFLAGQNDGEAAQGLQVSAVPCHRYLSRVQDRGVID